VTGHLVPILSNLRSHTTSVSEEKTMHAFIALLFAGAALAQDMKEEAAPTSQISCEGVTVDTFERVDVRAASLMVNMEVDELLAFGPATADTLSCLNERLTPSAAASVHGMMAIVSLASGDKEAVAVSLHSARRASALWRLPASIPGSHPIHRMYASAANFASVDDPIVAPEGFTFAVDGVIERTRDLDAGATVQQIGGDGAVLSTRYLPPSIPWSQ